MATDLECAWQQADTVACQCVCEAGLAAAVEQLHACFAALGLVLAVNVHDQLRHQHTSGGAAGQQAAGQKCSSTGMVWFYEVSLFTCFLGQHAAVNCPAHAVRYTVLWASLWLTHRHGCHTSAWVLVGGLVEEQHLVAANTCADRGAQQAAALSAGATSPCVIHHCCRRAACCWLCHDPPSAVGRHASPAACATSSLMLFWFL